MGLALWGVNSYEEFWMFTLQSGVTWSLWLEVNELKQHWNCGYQVSHFIYFSIYLFYLLKPCRTFSWWWWVSAGRPTDCKLCSHNTAFHLIRFNCCCFSLFTQSFYCFLLLSFCVFIVLCFFYFLKGSKDLNWTETERMNHRKKLNYNICNNRKPRRLMLWTGLKAAFECH